MFLKTHLCTKTSLWSDGLMKKKRWKNIITQKMWKSAFQINPNLFTIKKSQHIIIISIIIKPYELKELFLVKVICIDFAEFSWLPSANILFTVQIFCCFLHFKQYFFRETVESFEKKKKLLLLHRFFLTIVYYDVCDAPVRLL